MKTFLKAHLISLKVLIFDILILPYKIYSKTLCALTKNDKKSDSNFWVLHWITKCYDAIIGLSYTIGLILFFLSLINVVDSGMYETNYDGKEVSQEEWEDFSEYKWCVDSNGEEHYDDLSMTSPSSENEEYYKEKYDGYTFYIDYPTKELNLLSLLLHLVVIYFLPLYIHLIKEFFSIPIMKVIGINEIAKNTKK